MDGDSEEMATTAVDMTARFVRSAAEAAPESFDPTRMHRYDPDMAAFADQTFAFVRDRLRGLRQPMAIAPDQSSLHAAIGDAITATGLGPVEALALFSQQ